MFMGLYDGEKNDVRSCSSLEGKMTRLDKNSVSVEQNETTYRPKLRFVEHVLKETEYFKGKVQFLMTSSP